MRQYQIINLLTDPTAGWLAILSHRELRVLLVIARHINAAGECWPSLKTIAEMSRLPISKLSGVFNSLEEKGLLTTSTNEDDETGRARKIRRISLINPTKKTISMSMLKRTAMRRTAPESAAPSKTPDNAMTMPRTCDAHAMHDSKLVQCDCPKTEQRHSPKLVQEPSPKLVQEPSPKLEVFTNKEGTTQGTTQGNNSAQPPIEQLTPSKSPQGETVRLSEKKELTRKEHEEIKEQQRKRRTSATR